jgi:uncharacterized protein YqeY
MIDRMRADLLEAMKRKDSVAVSALRAAMAAIANAEAVPVDGIPTSLSGDAHFAGSQSGLAAAEAPRRDLGPEEIELIVRAEITDREKAAGQYAAHGRHDDSDRLRAEIAVLTLYVDG